MNRDDIKTNILKIFETEFEIIHPGVDDNLTEEHDFDSIDALELLGEIEKMLGSELTRQEKKDSMEIRTVNQICDYVVSLAQKRSLM
ncbi:MAG: phosphopantetheine-binding protein [Deltaproteobacteria bacterium]|jgi:acyl carrier protein|nr:phosphopantetheine-binding protein [Deltaproteobacteria bacterium]